MSRILVQIVTDCKRCPYHDPDLGNKPKERQPYCDLERQLFEPEEYTPRGDAMTPPAWCPLPVTSDNWAIKKFELVHFKEEAQQ